jgi:hypothetical protein
VVKIADEEVCPCGSGLTFGDCHGRKIRERAASVPSKHIPLTVITPPDPNTRSVLEKTGGDTIIFNGLGAGPDSLDCGGCDSPLAVSVAREQFQGIVLRCLNCGAYNDT